MMQQNVYLMIYDYIEPFFHLCTVNNTFLCDVSTGRLYQAINNKPNQKEKYI